MRELEGVALERKVAEWVMGWTPHTNYGDNEPAYPSYNFSDVAMVVWRSWNRNAVDWSPLRSMSNAWEIVTAMAAKGYKHSLLTDSAGCTSRFAKEDSLIGDVYSGYALPGNPGEAICRAALSAVSEGEME